MVSPQREMQCHVKLRVWSPRDMIRIQEIECAQILISILPLVNEGQLHGDCDLGVLDAIILIQNIGTAKAILGGAPNVELALVVDGGAIGRIANYFLLHPKILI